MVATGLARLKRKKETLFVDWALRVCGQPGSDQLRQRRCPGCRSHLGEAGAPHLGFFLLSCLLLDGLAAVGLDFSPGGSLGLAGFAGGCFAGGCFAALGFAADGGDFGLAGVGGFGAGTVALEEGLAGVDFLVSAGFPLGAGEGRLAGAAAADLAPAAGLAAGAGFAGGGDFAPGAGFATAEGFSEPAGFVVGFSGGFFEAADWAFPLTLAA